MFNKDMILDVYTSVVAHLGVVNQELIRGMFFKENGYSQDAIEFLEHLNIDKEDFIEIWDNLDKEFNFKENFSIFLNAIEDIKSSKTILEYKGKLEGTVNVMSLIIKGDVIVNEEVKEEVLN